MARTRQFVRQHDLIKERPSLTWRNLTVVRDVPIHRQITGEVLELLSDDFKSNNPKRVLKKVSGSVLGGELVAILGPSGSGKTTLLKALYGQLYNATIKGKILVNGNRRTKAWRHQAAFVEQNQVLKEHLTVRETIEFTALLRLPKSLRKKEVKLKVDKLIDDLALHECADTRIENLSGGQRKRCCMGMELIASPQFLLLGLDSFTALHIVQSARKLAMQQSKVVIMSIHQPRFNIAEQFTKILLLSQGHQVFFGSVIEAMEYFSGLNLHCPLMANPLDFLLDEIIVDTRSKVLQLASEDKLKKLIDSWKVSKLNQFAGYDKVASSADKMMLIDKLTEQITRNWNDYLEEQQCWNDKPSVVRQVVLLVSRNLVDYRRFHGALIAIVLQTLVVATLTALIFFQLGTTQSDIQNRIGLLFFIVVQETFAFVMPLSIVFPVEKSQILRERQSVTYKAFSVYFAKISSVIPQAVVSTLIFGAIVYWCTGLVPMMYNYTIFMTVLMTLVLCAQSLGMLIGALIETVQVALIVGPMVTLLFVVFSGNIVNSVNMPGAFVWIQYISPCAYAYKALMQNEFQGLPSFQCTDVSISGVCFQTGQQVLDYYNLAFVGVWESCLAIAGLTILFHALAFIALSVKTRPEKLQI